MCSEIVIKFLRRWKKWLLPFVVVLYVASLAILTVVITLQSVSKGISTVNAAILISSIFVLLAIPISVGEIVFHTLNYTNPDLQKYIIRILWMVPIYALNSWTGLIYPSNAVYFDGFRECYEAYVIHNFMKYLTKYLNQIDDLESVMASKPQVRHIFPCCYLEPWNMDGDFLYNCRHGILQYTVVRPLTSVLAIICEFNHVYNEGSFDLYSAFPYLILINNLSQFLAMYCLVLFYKATYAELAPMRPLAKFLCIKAVVFFSFFQGVTISILAGTGVITSFTGIKDEQELKIISTTSQDFLICIEMFGAAIAHHFAFSHKPFINQQENSSFLSSLLAMLDVSDMRQDIVEHITVLGGSMSRHLRGKSMYITARGYNESSHLMSDQAAPASSALDLEVETTGTLRPSVYGSIGTPLPTGATGSANSDNEPLINITDYKTNPEV